jgi:heptosyltransferase-2
LIPAVLSRPRVAELLLGKFKLRPLFIREREFRDEILFMTERDKEIPFGEIRRVLIRSANWVGDAVMSLPAIASIRVSFPRAKIVILAKPWVADLFQGSTAVDRVWVYRSPGPHEGFWGKWRLAQELKPEKFEIALLLQNAFEAAWIAFLARISRRAGYGTDGRTLLLTHPVRLNSGIRRGHQIDYYLNMVRSLGCSPVSGIPSLQVPEGRRKEARERLAALGVQGSEPLVGFSPGATYGSAKEWFPERYAELAGRLIREFGARILVFGSSSGTAIPSGSSPKKSPSILDLTEKTTLAQAVALIAQCRLFVTNDSGLMHVAAALGVPLVAIFGSTDPQRTRPLGHHSRILYKALPCGPCLKTQCPENRECMEAITVEEVFEEVKKAWQLREYPKVEV